MKVRLHIKNEHYFRICSLYPCYTGLWNGIFVFTWVRVNRHYKFPSFELQGIPPIYTAFCKSFSVHPPCFSVATAAKFQSRNFAKGELVFEKKFSNFGSLTYWSYTWAMRHTIAEGSKLILTTSGSLMCAKISTHGHFCFSPPSVKHPLVPGLNPASLGSAALRPSHWTTVWVDLQSLIAPEKKIMMKVVIIVNINFFTKC